MAATVGRSEDVHRRQRVLFTRSSDAWGGDAVRLLPMIGPLRKIQRRRERAAWAAQGAQIGAGANVAPGSRLTAGTSIGHDTGINGAITIKGHGRVSIGACCAIGEHVTLVTDLHNTEHPNILKGLHRRHGFVEIGEDRDIEVGPACWVGDGVTVLPGTVIGAGCVLAAGAVVRGTIMPYTIVGGVPARLLRERCSPEVAAVLVDIAWWDWPDERVARNKAFFEAKIADLTEGDLRALVV
jgi:virginiamycin A acetyltransferase